MIKSILFCLVFLIFGICGCAKIDQSHLREAIYTYGHKTAEYMYTSSGYIAPDRTFYDFEPTIVSLNINSVNTEEGGGFKLHYIKAKMKYQMKEKYGNSKYDHVFVRYMKIVIQESGQGDMVVRNFSDSKEIFTAGENEKIMRALYAQKVEEGENMIRW